MYNIKSTLINKTLIVSTLLFSLTSPIFASTDNNQDQEAQPSQQAVNQESNNQQTQESNSKQKVERITVDGDEQLTVLRYNYFRAEDNFFDAFNQLTDNTDFHITCEKKKRHSFTRIKLRDCDSEFEKRITSELLSEVMLRNPAAPSLTVPLGLINAKKNKAREKQIAAMEELILQSPQLQQRLITLIEAKKKLDDAKTGK